VSDRDDIPSVVLYDTSGDTDININEAILKAIEADGGGIDTPRNISPAITPRTASPAPSRGDSRVQSPVPAKDSRVVSPSSSSDRVSSLAGSGDGVRVTSLAGSIDRVTSPAVSGDGVHSPDCLNNNIDVPIQDNEGCYKLSPYKLPPPGEYLDVHVNFVDDPHNFVVSFN